MTILNRSAALGEIDRTGRTLEGLAFAYEHPSMVSDDGRTTYWEEFARSSADKSIAERGTVPLGMLHPWGPNARTSPIPLGSVRFESSAEGLMFRAVVSKTQAGDEALELVADEALSDVSIGARAIRNGRRQSSQGTVIVRQEIALRELSLVPTGMAAHEGAKVLVMRAQQEAEGTPRLDQVRRRLILLG